jgi:hypothetical protein
MSSTTTTSVCRIACALHRVTCCCHRFTAFGHSAMEQSRRLAITPLRRFRRTIDSHQAADGLGPANRDPTLIEALETVRRAYSVVQSNFADQRRRAAALERARWVKSECAHLGPTYEKQPR